ncbi:MAG TPA: DUF6305 family protein [Thermotogota bacterium]|nr:DUF6305 family protein [Thermotogota bacterium]HPJ88476.1 DUF6305 family protein [Thermotogota bacterium]HPR96485.1 DUF6305 family protein [Thermotogota bacterium]
MKKNLILFVLIVILTLSVFSAEDVEKLGFPVVLTSGGQSDEVNTVIFLLEEVELAYDYCDILSKDELAAGVGLGGAENAKGKHVTVTSEEAKGTPFKTLWIALGASLKGMGASGLSVDDEVGRINELIDYAKANNIKVLTFAIGGEIRRGLPGSPNEAMIDAIAPYSDIIVVTEETNLDDRFDAIAEENGILLIEVESAFDLLDTIPEIFAER